MYELYALCYALSGARHGAMVQGAGDERIPIAWLFFCAVSPTRRVLIDTGCSDEKVMGRQEFEAFQRPVDLLARIGVRPADVTDVVVTHMHWDHVADAGFYRNAKVYVQRQALQHAESLVNSERPHYQAVRLAELQAVKEAEKDGRLSVLSGDFEVADGLEVRLAGGHYPGLQYAVVRTRIGPVVLASDNAYTYENVETETPPGLCADPEEARSALREMKTLVEEPHLVIPGHERAVTMRFEKVADGVFKIG